MISTMKLFDYFRKLVNKTADKRDKNSLNQEIPPCSEEPPEPLFTMAQAAKKNGVTRQAIFFAIKMKRLNARRENNTWLVSGKDLKDYVENKYSRQASKKQGQLVFDKSKGFYSIGEAAKFLNKSTNQVYYLVRMGKIKTHRQGGAIVIHKEELYKICENLNKKSDKLDIG